MGGYKHWTRDLRTSSTIALRWDTIAVENHNGILRHYLVSVKEAETGEVDVYTAVATQLNISGLHPYYTYTCMVAAVTNTVGPFSHNVSIMTPQGGKYKICNNKFRSSQIFFIYTRGANGHLAVILLCVSLLSISGRL